MSELRQQLESARDAYHEQRYPGDLASELLPPRVVSRPWIFTSIATGALAAAASVLLMLGQPIAPPTPLPTVASLRAIPTIALSMNLPTQVSGLPYLTLAPPLQRFIPQGLRDFFAGHPSEPAITPEASPAMDSEPHA